MQSTIGAFVIIIGFMLSAIALAFGVGIACGEAASRLVGEDEKRRD